MRRTLNARAEVKKTQTLLDAERLKSQKADERAQAAEARAAELPKLHETITAREAECEERWRDVAAFEYRFFELEKEEDALRAQTSEAPRLREEIASLEAGMCVVDRLRSTYSRSRAELQQREEESDANQGKIQDLESRLQEAET
jgi:hypothetical protein